MRKTSSLLMSLLLTLSLFSPVVSAEGEVTTPPSDTVTITNTETPVTTVEPEVTEPSEAPPVTETEPTTVEPTVTPTTPVTPEVAPVVTTSETEAPVVVEEPIEEPEAVEPPKEEEPKEEETEQATPVPKDGIENHVEKGGVHVKIFYTEDSGSAGYIPEFTLIHGDAKGKILSTVVAGPQNYDKDTQAYHLVFNNPGYKLGEKYQILLSKADPIIDSLEMNVTYFEGEEMFNETTTLKENNYFVFTVRSQDYYKNDEEGPAHKVLTPSPQLPIEGNLTTDRTKTGFIMQNEKGQPLKNVQLNIENTEKKAPITLKTNSKGVAWVDSNKLSTRYKVFSIGREVIDTKDGTKTIVKSSYDESQYSALTYVIKFKNSEKEVTDVADVSATSLLNLKVSTPANLELSSYWANADVVFTNSKGEKFTFTVGLDDKEIVGLPDGKYSVKTFSKYADVSLSSSTVSINKGKGSLNVVVKPKFVLEVDKDNKDFSFTVLNVEALANKKYTGKKQVVFAVTPGESYMIKDNQSGEVYTVAIDSKSTVTRLVLGTGVVFGGSATIPHTGDGIMFLVALFFATLLGAGVSYLIYTNKFKIKGLLTKAVTVLLIGAMLGSLLPQNTPTASAAEKKEVLPIGSGTPGSGGGSSLTPKGLVQTDPYVSAIMMGITNGSTSDGSVKLNKNSDKDDLANPFKFEEQRIRNMLFMTTNKTNYDIFARKSSEVLTFRGGYLYKHHGVANSAIFPKTKWSNWSVEGSPNSKYLLPLPETAVRSKNLFTAFMGYSTLYLNEKNATNRQIWKGDGSVSLRNIGDSLSEEYKDWLVNNLTSENETLIQNGRLNTTGLIQGYIDILSVGDKHQKQAAKVLEEGLRAVIGSENDLGNYVILTQVVQSFYVKGASPRNYAFMPLHDAAEWYAYGRGASSSKFKTVNTNHEARIIYGITNRDASFSTPSSKYTPSATYLGNIQRTSGFAMKPKTIRAPIIKPTTSEESIVANPFTGWGYLNLGFLEGANSLPKLTGNYRVKVLDTNGVATGEVFNQPLTMLGSDGRELSSLGASTPIEEGLQFKSRDGRIFTIKPNANSNITLYDTEDTKDNLLALDTAVTGKVAIPSLYDPTKWLVEFGYEIPYAHDLEKYLGGTNTDSFITSKYSSGKFSNAHLIIDVEATADPVVGAQAPQHGVPQWRLSKYYPDLAKGSYDKSSFDLTLPASEGDNQKLSPSGNLKFDLIGPDLKGASWAYSKPKLFKGDTEKKNISLHSLVASWNLSGSLLAVKDASVTDVKLAAWKNNFNLFDDKIKASSKGSTGNKAKVVKTHDFVYGVKSPFDPFTFRETRYEWIPGVTDFYGNVISGGYDKPYSWSANATSNYNNSQYNTSLTFNNYVPKTVTKTKTFANADDSVNGTYWETKQSKDVLRVNPEVLMAYDDTSGNTSVAFVAGEQLRPIQPITYNLAQYVNVDVQPTVTGMNTATDIQAKSLAQKLRLTNLGVTYKGSAITTNFEVAGDIELKTFAVDIGSSALKNAWNPASTYSTDTANDEFLARHATKKADGTWEIALNAEGKQKINGVEYGGKKSVIRAPQVSQNVVEHTLVIRGGRVVSVDGNTNLNSLPAELKNALARMKVTTATNIFSNFERNTGAVLTEPNVAALGNAVRGSNDMAVGQGWYSEDTTTVVVREYTNTFKLPSVLAVDKVPMEIPSLETPMDKSKFFSTGYVGHSVLRFKLVNANMEYDGSDTNTFGGEISNDYIIPNVSIMDTFQ